MNVVVRMADYEDLPVVLEQFINEVVPSAGLAFPPVNRDKAAVGIALAIAEKRLLVVDQNGEVVGSASLRLHQYIYADAMYLSDEWVYVRPGHRSFPAFRALCVAMKDIAKKTGVPLQVGILRTDDVDRKRAAYERMGFTVCGANLVWGL